MSHHLLKHIPLLAAAALASGFLAGCRTPEVPEYSIPQKPKKLIHFGWCEPHTLQQFKAPLKDLEENCPLDGIGIRPVFMIERNGKEIPYAIERALGSPERLTHDDFKEWIPVLKRLQQTRLKHNFILTASILFNADWFDDDAWSRSLNNFETMAWLAHESNFDGICLDVEPYRHSGLPFKFRPELGHSFEDTEAQVRKRAADWTRAINRQFPGITLFAFFWTSQCNSAELAAKQTMPNNSPMALQRAFFNGVYDAAPENMKIVDGNESPGYHAADEGDYSEMLYNFLVYSHAWIDSVNIDKYKRITQMACAQYLDSYIPRKLPTAWRHFQKSDNATELLRKNIALCFKYSDEYAWIWAEHGSFWPKITATKDKPYWNEKLPYTKEAIEAGREPAAALLKYAGKNLLLNSAMTAGDSGPSGGPGQVASGMKNWSKYIEPGITNGDITPQNGMAHFKNCGGSCLTQVTRNFKPGARYIVTARAKSLTGAALPQLGYFFRNAKNTCIHDPVEKESFFVKGDDGWTRAILTFRVPRREDLVTMTITCASKDIPDLDNSGVFVDDIELKQVVYPWDK